MTDQLEHDLRTMLADRATSVTVDPATSEQTIADRLRAGDETLADVVPLAARSPRRRWLVAAAAGVLLVAGLAAVLTRDDDAVTLVTPQPTGDPVIFTAPGDAEAVAQAYLEDRLDAPSDAIDLRPSDSIGAADAAGFDWTRTDVDQDTGGFVGLLERDGRWAVLEAFSDGPSIDVAERDADSVTVHTTGPAGSYVQLSVHRLSGESLTAGGCGGEVVGAGAEEPTEPVGCSLVDEPIAEGDDPLTVRFSVVTQDGVRLTLEERLLLAPPDPELAPEPGVGPPDDPTVGEPGQAAKDVAEGLMVLLGDPAVTESVTRPSPGTSEVTMETISGATIVATVVFDQGLNVFRLTSLASPGLSGTLDDGQLFGELPEPGVLKVRGFTDAFVGEIDATPPGGTRVEAGRQGPLPQPPDEYVWLVLHLETDDGRRLWGISRR